MSITAFFTLSCLALLPASAPAQTTEAPKLRVLLTFGGHDFQHKEFFAMWDAMPGVTYTKAPLPESAGLLKPGLEKQYDAIVMYDMVPSITPEQRAAFVALLNTGIGLVSLHHNLGAHPDWPEFRKIVGGKYLLKPETIDESSYPASTYDHDQDLHITVADKAHPITQGIADYDIHDEAYGQPFVDPKVHVLLTAKHPRSGPVVGWTWHYGKSRVVYLMGGHDSAAWANPNFPKLVLQSIRWTAAGR